MKIPFVDIFAGPGGLGEGFSSFNHDGGYNFRSVLSIEKDPRAHQTLELRSFFRQFRNLKKNVPKEYYSFIKGEITREELFTRFPVEAKKAKSEAQCIELGGAGEKNSNENVDELITHGVRGSKIWGLLGGPPCQAYSVIGRARQGHAKASYDEKTDLYKHYLRILAFHQPTFFIFENVKGIVSARKNGKSLFDKIVKDLSYPCISIGLGKCGNDHAYDLYSFKAGDEFSFTKELDGNHRKEDYIIHSEDYGIPQKRHRMIILGILKGSQNLKPKTLSVSHKMPVSQALQGLPKLRSGISDGKDSFENWGFLLRESLCQFREKGLIPLDNFRIDEELENLTRGGEYVACNTTACRNGFDRYYDWILDDRMQGVVNHSTRSHLETDIQRYLFYSLHAIANDKSPKLAQLPNYLLPDHKNVKSGKFQDRFRVQLANQPSTTITSHISKDGHYYIHPDPSQCRSLTVREAARLQSFPDNYFFCGPRTSQYLQVGNAVPPLLANQMAEIIYSWARESDLI